MGDKVKTERDANILKLLEKAKLLPLKPGCYLMKNKQGKVIYIGKAKKLRSRVTSYFHQGAKSPKTDILVSHIRDFDFVLTSTEAEALVLENTLIKKHIPKYNIMMRDDKSYPYVIVDNNEPYPRLEYKRRWKRKKNVEVFGPFAHGSNISQILRVLVKSFKLRDCSLREFRSRKEPCLLYQIKQCSAPCVGEVTDSTYSEDLNLALSFIKGKGTKGLKVLKSYMEEHAAREEFEAAAILRDHIETLESFLSISQQQNAEFAGKNINADVIAYFEGDEEIDLALYSIRKGILLGHKNFHFLRSDFVEEIKESVRDFIFQYYSESHDTLPDKVIIDFEDDLLGAAFKEVEDFKKMNVARPARTFRSLMDLAIDQAKEHQNIRKVNEDSVYLGLNKLKDLLGLKERPVTLECYDIAIFQGSSPTAAQIVFEEGKPNKKRYRHYKLEERPEGNNDFIMMEEVIARRIKHGNLPDVFIVDGGKGQVSAFTKILNEMNIDVPVCGLAKSKVIAKKDQFKLQKVSKTEERLIIQGRANPYYLSKNKSLYQILTQMRDEAHRFSRRLHHKGESDKLFSSWIDQVEGVGPKTKEKILKKLDIDKSKLSKMTKQNISTYLDVSLKIAENILKVLV
jgi:excinuclease ABC subunit C